MIFIFAGIVAGIIIGVLGSLFVAWVLWREETSDFDLSDLMMHDLEPDEPLFVSEMQRHREAHLAVRRDQL